jgi:hypothetical protein
MKRGKMAYTEPKYCIYCEKPTSLCVCLTEDVYEVLWRGEPKSAATLARQIALDVAGIAPTPNLVYTLMAWEKAIRKQMRT